uniref:Uncharacterized protein n=1 Tax=Magallana gigas TaxID=29159 RepID=A0A8W8LF48_MAGGI
MPDGSKEPICKEGISDSIIPGCVPLPTSDGRSWRTESGRPIQVKSTVYEVYYPICSQNGILNRDLHSARCGEDLRWNASIQGLRCLYGCGPFPIGSKWRLQNGSEAGNESLIGETYFSECSPGHKRSIVMYCGPELKWHTNYSTPCETDKCGICVGVGGLILVVVVILIVYAVYRSRRNPPVPTEEPEDAPLKEFTFTVSNTPGERQPETIGDLKGEFLQMTVAKQECASA